MGTVSLRIVRASLIGSSRATGTLCIHPQVAAGLFVFFLCNSGIASARTWNIRPNGSGDAPTIQAGIDSATAFDSLVIAPGIYQENLLIGKTLTILSSEGPGKTIVDGSSAGRVVTIDTGASNGPTLIGLTFRNGYAQTQGGGVWVGSSGTVLQNNIIEHNTAGTLDVGQGGGLYVNFTVTTCLVEGNEIRHNFSGSSGGGVYIIYTEMRRNRIYNNFCPTAGAGAVVSSGARFSNNVVYDNVSQYSAGGVWVKAGELANNTIVRNRTLNTDRVPSGVFISSNSVVRNNIIALNSAGGGGDGAGVMCDLELGNTIWCNDVWGNDGQQLRCIDVWPTNFSLDPVFCDTTSADFHIAWTSPCSPPQSSCDLVGALDPSCLSTRIEEWPWTRVKLLFR